MSGNVPPSSPERSTSREEGLSKAGSGKGVSPTRRHAGAATPDSVHGSRVERGFKPTQTSIKSYSNSPLASPLLLGFAAKTGRQASPMSSRGPKPPRKHSVVSVASVTHRDDRVEVPQHTAKQQNSVDPSPSFGANVTEQITSMSKATTDTGVASLEDLKAPSWQNRAEEDVSELSIYESLRAPLESLEHDVVEPEVLNSATENQESKTDTMEYVTPPSTSQSTSLIEEKVPFGRLSVKPPVVEISLSTTFQAGNAPKAATLDHGQVSPEHHILPSAGPDSKPVEEKKKGTILPHDDLLKAQKLGKPLAQVNLHGSSERGLAAPQVPSEAQLEQEIEPTPFPATQIQHEDAIKCKLGDDLAEHSNAPTCLLRKDSPTFSRDLSKKQMNERHSSKELTDSPESVSTSRREGTTIGSKRKLVLAAERDEGQVKRAVITLEEEQKREQEKGKEESVGREKDEELGGNRENAFSLLEPARTTILATQVQLSQDPAQTAACEGGEQHVTVKEMAQDLSLDPTQVLSNSQDPSSCEASEDPACSSPQLTDSVDISSEALLPKAESAEEIPLVGPEHEKPISSTDSEPKSNKGSPQKAVSTPSYQVQRYAATPASVLKTRSRPYRVKRDGFRESGLVTAPQAEAATSTPVFLNHLHSAETPKLGTGKSRPAASVTPTTREPILRDRAVIPTPIPCGRLAALREAEQATAEAHAAPQFSIKDKSVRLCCNRARLKFGSFPSASGLGLDTQRKELRQRLLAAVNNGESSSTIVLGDRGSGKSFLMERVLHDLRSDEGCNNFTLVKLNGQYLTDDVMAIREITRQLAENPAGRNAAKVAGYSATTKGTFSQHLAFLRTVLREGTNSAHGIPVVFVLDRFEAFAKRAKQTLLYNLVDLSQSRDFRVVVVGLTDQLDVASALEKRVKSRFDSGSIYISHPSFETLQSILLERLEIENEDEWNAAMRSVVFQNKRTVGILRRLHLLGYSIGRFFALFNSALGVAAHARPPRRLQEVLQVSDFKDIEQMLLANPIPHLVAGLSVTEMALLVAMMHLEKTLGRPVFNYEMIYEQMSLFFSKGSTNMECATKATARNAFEHLLCLNLAVQRSVPLEECSGQGRTHVPDDFRSVRLMIDPEEVTTLIGRNPKAPTALQQWAKETAAA